MKQLEIKNQKIITNALNFYREIGIDITVFDKYLSKDNKKKNKDIKICELEDSFRNFEGCKLKKTSTNFVSFYGNPNSKLLIIDGPPDVEEDKKGVSFVSSKGLLFEKMLDAIDQRDFEKAAEELLDSRYAQQVKRRALANSSLLNASA